MVTTTCANSGCYTAITRKELLTYVDNSGGRNFPFSTDGKVLRVATAGRRIPHRKACTANLR